MSPEDVTKFIAAQKQQVANAAKQIVDTGEKRVNDEIDPKAKYLSRFNQRVVQETRAQKVGAFKNDAGQGKLAQPAPSKAADEQAQKQAQKQTQSKPAELAEPKDKPSKIATYKDGDFDLKDDAATETPNSGLQAFAPTFRKLPVVPDPTQSSGDGNEVSSTDDHLKDVKTGMETMLSTREFVYYSYYNRIKEKLRQYWEPKIKEKFERIIRQGRHIASDGNDKITKLVIILDEKGTLVGVQILGASGVTDLDDAAIEAFRAAAPFPNPPKGIVEPDGTIKIRWDFVLEA